MSATSWRAPVALVPGTLALLPEYAGQIDPVAPLRDAALRAVSAVVGGTGAGSGTRTGAGPDRVVVVASDDPVNRARGVDQPRGVRVARSLLAEAGWSGELVELVVADDGTGVLDASGSLAAPAPGEAWLVIGNGSARRSEKAPGHLDPEAASFDASMDVWLAAGDLAALSKIDLEEASRLLADLAPIAAAASRLSTSATGRADVIPLLADDPYGVQWWVQTWEVPCAS